jgi:phytoene dehydrogenase-like protein
MTDAIVIGAGPNGLAAAIVCARAGLRVRVYEAGTTPGGGARTLALTRPGFLHDHCASVLPFAAASPFFRTLPLAEYGVEWVHPHTALAHPLENDRAALLDRSLDATARVLGVDAARYEGLMRPFVRNWSGLAADVLAPFRPPAHPWLVVRFGIAAVQPASVLAQRFQSVRARALIAGIAAHSGQPLDAPLTSAFALLLGVMGHGVGWPVARGGTGAISGALAAVLREHGGTIECDTRIEDITDLPRADLVFCDLSPEQLAHVARRRLPAGFARRLHRFRRSSATFKVDWALDGPIPWRDEACRQAGTVHVGGTLEEIAASEASPRQGRVAERPFVLLTQPTVCDASRAPAGRHVAWGYCHVPLGCPVDMTGAIERQVERFAPGFRDRILARHVLAPGDFERHNASLVQGDISGGALTFDQFVTRPTWRQYATPVEGLYLCSSATPPGAGVHGMCGYWAARTALRDRGVPIPRELQIV